MWSIQNILLLIAGIINLAMSIFIISRGWKNKVNLYFSLMTFFNFLWATGLLFVNPFFNSGIIRFAAAVVYPIALMVVVSLFYFIIYFPYKIFSLSKFYNNLIFGIVFIISIFCIFGYKIFAQDVSLIPRLVVHYEFWSYFIYTVLLMTLMILGVLILFLKFKKADGIFKWQLKLVLMAVIIGTSGGLFFNVYLVTLGIFDYMYLGLISTLFINGVAFYFIKSSPKTN